MSHPGKRNIDLIIGWPLRWAKVWKDYLFRMNWNLIYKWNLIFVRINFVSIFIKFIKKKTDRKKMSPVSNRERNVDLTTEWPLRWAKGIKRQYIFLKNCFHLCGDKNKRKRFAEKCGYDQGNVALILMEHYKPHINHSLQAKP